MNRGSVSLADLRLMYNEMSETCTTFVWLEPVSHTHFADAMEWRYNGFCVEAC